MYVTPVTRVINVSAMRIMAGTGGAEAKSVQTWEAEAKRNVWFDESWESESSN